MVTRPVQGPCRNVVANSRAQTLISLLEVMCRTLSIRTQVTQVLETLRIRVWRPPRSFPPRSVNNYLGWVALNNIFLEVKIEDI